jgi:CBS domain-containing protein
VAASLRRAATFAPTTPVSEVAAAMGKGAGAAFVVDDDGAPSGIVTDRDLRMKVVAARRASTSTAAADVMSAPVVVIRSDAFAFEALVEMTRREIHHLGVVEGGRLVGLVTSEDLMALSTAHPVVLAREIAGAESSAALAALAARMTPLVGRLVRDGGRASDIGGIVAELNDRIVARALVLAEGALAEREGPPPAPYCWMVFGSEGRREQTLRTDQDNGLVYADPPEAAAPATAAYFGALAAAAIEGLLAAGFPACPGGVMASNPKWCQPLAVWRGYFEDWMLRPGPEHLLAAAIYFDLRPVHGALDLGESLAALIACVAPGQRAFLGALAREVVGRRLPTTLFGRIAVERRGPRRGAVDLKTGGTMQIVGAGRVHALELGVRQTSTAERLAAAGAAGLYSAAETTEIVDAFEHLLRLRLVHQIACIEAGEPPDNHVAPDRLSHRDGVLLRDAFKTVARLQAGLRDRFGSDFQT